MDLSCRFSIKPKYAREFCKKLNLELPKDLIYTKEKYRETSEGKPRVDCLDLLRFSCEKLDVKPNKKKVETSKKMFGEGSRRELLEEAYLN